MKQITAISLILIIILSAEVLAENVIVPAPILCTKNSDCGVSVNIFSCAGRYITKKQFTPTCISFLKTCTTTVRVSAVKLCKTACIQGNCAGTVSCNSNFDCDDGNSNTRDTCINPGTSTSFCQHNDLDDTICNDNDDCGSGRFVSDAYCSGRNVVGDFEYDLCQNPGTIFSFCTSPVFPRAIGNCKNMCLNGKCI